MKNKFSLIVLAASVAFSGSALAAGNVWDSATPWDSSTLAQLAEWNTFDSAAFDNTPESGTGSISLSPPGGFLFDTNIYTFNSIPTVTGTLAGTAGVFDVYLRVASQGNPLVSTATLNGVSASSILGYTAAADLGAGTEEELYWVWKGVTGGDLYTFQFQASTAHILIDQIALATVAVTAVPEPSSYAMLALGLGMLGAAGRRARKQAQ